MSSSSPPLKRRRSNASAGAGTDAGSSAGAGADAGSSAGAGADAGSSAGAGADAGARVKAGASKPPLAFMLEVIQPDCQVTTLRLTIAQFVSAVASPLRIQSEYASIIPLAAGFFGMWLTETIFTISANEQVVLTLRNDSETIEADTVPPGQLGAGFKYSIWTPLLHDGARAALKRHSRMSTVSTVSCFDAYSSAAYSSGFVSRQVDPEVYLPVDRRFRLRCVLSPTEGVGEETTDVETSDEGGDKEGDDVVDV